MPLTLYSISGAPCPWRVTIGLAIKGVACEIKMLSASKKEHKAESYLKLNPRGTVPTLVNGTLVLRDSVAILAWLDRVYPAKPLFGETEMEAASIWQTTMEILDYLPGATSGVLEPIFFAGATDATDDLLRASEALRGELSTLDRLLGTAPFLSGARPGAADAVAFPHARLIQRAMDTKPDVMTTIGLENFGGLSSNIETWKAKMEGLPGLAATFPPHWSEPSE